MHTIPTLLATATLGLGLLVATPAQAASTVVNDGPDATASLTDILTMKVKHTQHRVVVTTTYANLTKRNDAGTSIFFDSDETRPGPEFVLTTGLAHGTDYQLNRARRWKPVGNPLDCKHSVELRRGKDYSKVWVSRACLGTPDQVRVNQGMSDYADGSHVVRDWAPRRRGFSPWVLAG